MVGIGLAIILGIIGVLSVRALQESTDRVLAERLRLAELVALHVDDHVSQTLALLERAATSEGFDLSDADPEPERRALRDLYRTGFFTYEVFITDKRGIIVWMEPPTPAMVGVDLTSEPEVRQALASGKPQVGNLTPLHDTGKAKVVFVAPVKNQADDVVGLIGGATDPASLALIAQPFEKARGGYVQIMDANGLVLAHSEGKHLLQPAEHADVLLALMAENKSGIVTRQVSEEGKGQISEVIAFVPSRLAPWGVFVEQPEAEVLAPVSDLRRCLILIGAAILLIGLVLTWLTTQAVVVPMRQLLTAARRVAAGDLTTPIAVAGRDEVAELGRGFEAMRQKLAAWGEELEGAVQKRTRELSALYAIDRAAAQSLELDEILNDALDKVLEVLEVEAGAILLLEPDSQMLTVRAHRGYSPEFIAAVQNISLGEAVASRAVAEGRPVVVDISEYPTARLAPFFVKEGIQTIASTPLLFKGQAFGALSLNSRHPRTFPPEEIELLVAIGEQLGGAVQNARLFEHEKQLAGYLRSLNQAVARASAGLDRERMAQTVVKCLVEQCNAALARIWLTDESGEYLILRASAGLATRVDGSRARISIADDPFKLGIIARERKPLITNQVQQEPYFDRAWAQREGLIAFAGYPILAEGRLLGVIALFSRQRLGQEMLDVLGTFVNQIAAMLVNTRLYEAEQRRAARLSSVLQLSTELAALRDESAVLNTLVTRAAVLADSATCTVMLPDETTNEAVLVAQTGLPESALGLRVPLTLPIIRRSLETGEPILAPNIDRDAPELRQVLVRKDIRAFFAYPMVREGRVLGFITLSGLTPRTPSAEEITTYRLLADRAAAALENARLFNEIQRRLTELTALFEVSSTLREAKTLDEMLPIILHSTVRVMQCDQGLLSLVDRERGEVIVRVTTPSQASLLGMRTKIGEGVSGRVVQTGVPMLPPDFANLQAPEPVRRVIGEPRTVICYPLKTGAEVVGTLYLSAPQPREFTEGDLKLLGAITDMAASAIHRASLFEQLEHRVHELTMLFDVGKMVTASLRVEEVLEFIVGAAARAVHAEGCYLFLWDERAERLVLRGSAGFLAEDVGRMRYRLGEGLAGWVFLERRAVNAPDLSVEPRWKRDAEHETPLPSGRANNALVVPLLVGQKILGVLGAVNKIGAPAFSESDESLLTALASEVAISIENARLYEDVRGLSIATIRSLATAIDARDPYTRGHSDEVTRLAVQLAREMGWSGADLEMLEFAALLHDVGKIAVPDAILRKVEPLTPDEWNIIRLHPYHNAQIVKPVESLQRIVPWIYHHQEKWDGTGYPDGLKGEAIPLAARIIAVVDAFNAMTTDRPYRRALSREQAIAELKRGAGTQFDPQVVEIFLRLQERD
jgi:putative nucleotidyltransferase with HDIG domain